MVEPGLDRHEWETEWEALEPLVEAVAAGRPAAAERAAQAYFAFTERRMLAELP